MEFLSIFVYISCLRITSVKANEMEVKLRSDFFKNRKSPVLRPVQSNNETIHVQMGLQLHHITELDEQKELLSFVAWIILVWTDLTFTWDPKDYDGIKYLSISQDLMWNPDITILNSAKNVMNDELTMNFPVFVNHRGDADLVYFLPLRTVCPLDLRQFPFDEHVCPLTFVSWLYNGREVNFTLIKHFNISRTLDEHNQWQLIDTRAEREVRSYNEYEWHYLNFYVHLRRRAPYYGLVLVVPILVATMMTLAVFWLSPLEIGKIILGGVAFCILVLQLMQLYWVVPRNGGKIPAIVLLCGNSLIFNVISIFLSMMSRRLCDSFSHLPVADLIKNYFSGFLGRVLCLTVTKKVPIMKEMQIMSRNADVLIKDKTETRSEIEREKMSDWIFIATAFDRICFILYCFIFTVIFLSLFG